MKPPNASEMMEVPLLTEADVEGRVSSLVGRAINPRQVWVMFLDHHRRQLPMLIPIDQTPPRPKPGMIDSLMGALAQVLDERAPGGSTVLTLERWGPTRPTRSDLVWIGALIDGARTAGVPLAGMFLVTSDDIQSMLRADLN